MRSSLTDFFELITQNAVALGIHYTFMAGLAWLLGYVIFKRWWFPRKVLQKHPPSSEVWREIRYSALTVFVFVAVGAATSYLAKAGYTQVYWKIDKYGTTWFWLSIVCAIFLHDAYFYWTHRLMHHPKLFKAFHRTHHLSHNPSPWAAYAFSPLEAVVEALILPLAVTIIPMHPFAFVIFMFCQIVFNVVGHTGYEIYPRWLMDSWLGKILNTPTNHAMHHEFIRGNYGLYFNIWDRLMGTNHHDYERRFREVTSRTAKAKENEAVEETPLPDTPRVESSPKPA